MFLAIVNFEVLFSRDAQCRKFVATRFRSCRSNPVVLLRSTTG